MSNYLNENGKNVAVIGSRNFDDYELLKNYLDERFDKIKYIVSGGASGGDELGRRYAEERGLPVIIFYPRWRDKNGIFSRAAGFIRNQEIVKNSDVVIAFMQKGGSKGTQNSIEIAKRLGKPVTIIEFTPKEKELDI